jgi:hypothetical protein
MAKFSLKNAPLAPLLEDFAFIVGTTQYKCSQVAASAYCRTVRLLLLSDPTASFIVYPEADPKSQFGIFVQALGGKKIRVDESNHSFLWRVSGYFQCDELKATISTFLQSFLTAEKCFLLLRGQRVPMRCSAEIEFLAKHFSEVCRQPEFEDLPLPILDAVLSNTGLSVEEGDLFEFVWSVVKKKRGESAEFSSLFAHVLFEEADSSGMKRFLEGVPAEDIGGALWAALAMRLEHSVVVDG